jgi:WD40 repeat protein
MAIIRGLAFTADGRQLVSVGDDKVIRVWDLQAGKTVRTIRGQVGPGDEGKIFAIALSPDGRWLAAGGWTNDNVIRLYDFASGTLAALLKGHTDVVHALAFSPDGKRLISGQDENIAAIIWDVEHQQLIHRLEGHKDTVYAVAFTPDGVHVVTGSNDRTLRLWRTSDAKLIAEMTGHTKAISRAVAVRSSDGMIASGDASGEIRLWDGTTGRYLRTFANHGAAVGKLVFSPDGKLLISTGQVESFDCHVWEVATGKKTITYTKHNNIVVAAAVSPSGRLAATAGGDNKEIRIWDLATGDTKQVLSGSGAGVYSVGVSTDAKRLAWGTTFEYSDHNARGPLELQLRLPSGSRGFARPERVDEHNAKDFVRARPRYRTYALAHREGGNPSRPDGILDIKKAGRTLASIDRTRASGYRHRAYSFTPDGQTIISGGSNGTLSAYDLNGKHLGDFVGHESEVWAVTPSREGRLLVSGSSDQTVRLWNLTTRELIVTFFYSRDGEWVIWTPQGYYASSPDGDRMVGWHINKGPDKAADYVTANQLRTHFYRPDIVERAIVLASAIAAMSQARGTDFSLKDLQTRRPPAFDIISPEDRSHAGATPIEIRLKLELNADPIEAIDVLVNGRQTTTPALRNATARLAASGTPERRIEVPLEQGENKIRVVARNKVGQTVRDFVLFHDKPGLLDGRGTLYVLAIGVDKYPKLPPTCGPNSNQACDLRYAGKDAHAFRDVLVKHAGSLYKDIKSLLLTRDGDKLPTRANIEDALGEILGKAGPEDTTILFVAGHGVNDARGSDYLFMPEEAEISSDGWRKSTVLPWILFQNALQNTQGRRLMFVDTCHSGRAYNSRLVNDAANANIVVFSATDPQTLSWEFEHLAHGVFTHALIQGIEGKARRKDGTVTVFGLGDFISEEVAKLTEDKQQPTFHISGAKNFMLAKGSD